MIKLVCEKCGHVWYTSNTRDNQECDECGGRLIEVNFINGIDVVIERKNQIKPSV